MTSIMELHNFLLRYNRGEELYGKHWPFHRIIVKSLVIIKISLFTEMCWLSLNSALHTLFSESQPPDSLLLFYLKVVVGIVHLLSNINTTFKKLWLSQRKHILIISNNCSEIWLFQMIVLKASSSHIIILLTFKECLAGRCVECFQS